MEEDLHAPGRLIVSEGPKLMSTNGVTSVTVMDPSVNLKMEFLKGILEKYLLNAFSGYLTGFTQLNGTHIVLVDGNGNNCLRVFDRATRQTLTLAGQCAISGFRDGTMALFNSPHSVIRNPRSASSLLVTDEGNQAIREVDFLTGWTTTLLKQSKALLNPAKMVLDINKKNLLISNQYFVSKYNLASETISMIAGGEFDGGDEFSKKKTLFQAKIERIKSIASLSSGITLVLASELLLINNNQNLVSGIGESRYCDDILCGYDVTDMLVGNRTIYLAHHRGISTVKCKNLCKIV